MTLPYWSLKLHLNIKEANYILNQRCPNQVPEGWRQAQFSDLPYSRRQAGFVGVIEQINH